jgi:hypothetical protein
VPLLFNAHLYQDTGTVRIQQTFVAIKKIIISYKAAELFKQLVKVVIQNLKGTSTGTRYLRRQKIPVT